MLAGAGVGGLGTTVGRLTGTSTIGATTSGTGATGLAATSTRAGSTTTSGARLITSTIGALTAVWSATLRMPKPTATQTLIIMAASSSPRTIGHLAGGGGVGRAIRIRWCGISLAASHGDTD